MHRKIPRELAGRLAAVLLSTGLANSLHANSPAIYNLGTLLGNYPSLPTGINNSGQVTGLSAGYAFLYSGTPGSGGAMLNLGTLTGGDESGGYAINDSGQITGVSTTSEAGTPPFLAHAFLYTGTPGNGGTMLDLGTLDGQGTSNGIAINNLGQVVGWSNVGGQGAHAFLYTGIPGNGGKMVDLGFSRPTYLGASGISVNDIGQVAGGGYVLPGTDVHALLYTGRPGSGSTLMDLGTLGGDASDAHAINNKGQIVGWSYLQSDPNANSHAFLYTGTPGHGGAMFGLGTLGGSYSSAEAINDSGEIVGYSGTSDSTEHAFLYLGTPGLDGHMIDLDAWLDATNPAEGANWTLTTAEGINDSGLIVGTGTYDDGIPADSGTRAYILDASALIPELAPEPGSLLLMILGSTVLLRRSRNLFCNNNLITTNPKEIPCTHST